MSHETLPCPHCGQPLHRDDADEPLPTRCSSCARPLTVGRDYAIIQLLGLGAVSVVYEAKRLSDQREVALKVLQPPYKHDPDAIASLEASTQLLQRLQHAQVPEVFDAFEDMETGQRVLVLEALEGKTLHDRLFHEGRRVPPERAEKFLLSLLELLAYLQTRSPPIIHRNIQPANLMFRTADDWIPILVDFDHVRASAHAAPIADPSYAAPEQLKGKDAPAHDLYSLALTTLTLLHAKTPTDLVAQHSLATHPARLDVDALTRGLDADLRVMLKRMLHPSPEQRFKDARCALAWLYARRTTRQTLKRRAFLAAAVAAIALMCGVIWTHRDKLIDAPAVAEVSAPMTITASP